MQTPDYLWAGWHLAEALCSVHARAVDKQRVKEDGVTLLHLQVHSRVLRVIVTHSMVHLVYATLKTEVLRPVFKWLCEAKTGLHFKEAVVLWVQLVERLYLPGWVIVLLQGAGVGSWEDNQAAVLPVHLLHGGPGADDLVRWTEGEVVQVLVHWVPRCLFA